MLRRRVASLASLATGLAALLMLGVGCAVPQPRGAGQLTRIVEPTTNRSYWRYLPKDYVKLPEEQRQARRWPLVVTFHGMKPFDGAHAQAREWEQEADRYGFIVVAPELRAFRVFAEFPLRTLNPAFQSDESATLAILDHVLQTTDADANNVLSTSWSSGGYMAHYMLNRHPDRFTCLAVRQSNFSAAVLSPEMVRQSSYHPILIINTQNDFGICQRESREAIEWYQTHGYHNCFWVCIKGEGHARTPDLAAYFFGLVCGVQPNTAPAVLVRRQAIDGNEEGIAFLGGSVSRFASPPTPRTFTRQNPRDRSQVSAQPYGTSDGRTRTPRTPDASNGDAARQSSAIPERLVRPNPVKIRISSALGIQPLHLGFSAECPASWRETAEFSWTLDGQPIGKGVNGQKTLVDAGEHTLGVRVVTPQGEEFRATRTVRVLPRLEGTSPSGSTGGPESLSDNRHE
jgi:predicted esterase